MPKITLSNNKVIHYLESGISHDKTIILLHGLGNRSITWEKQLSLLNSHFHVIAWDAPGYGESFNPDPLYKNFSDFSDILLEFVDALNLPKIYLLGHSMGAAIAIDFSYRFSHRVKKLVVSNPPRGSAFISEEKNKQKLNNRLYAINELGAYKLAKDRIKNLFSNNAPIDMIEKSEKIMQQVRSPGYASVSYSLYNLNQKDIYSNIKVPTMVVCGEDDKITPVPEAEYIHNNIPNSSFKLIPKTGHLCFVENPTTFSNYIIDFFIQN